MSTLGLSKLATQMYEARINSTREGDALLERLELSGQFNRFEFELDMINESIGQSLKRALVGVGTFAASGLAVAGAIAAIGLILPPMVGPLVMLGAPLFGLIIGVKVGGAVMDTMTPTSSKLAKDLNKLTTMRDSAILKYTKIENKESPEASKLMMKIDQMTVGQSQIAEKLMGLINKEHYEDGKMTREAFNSLYDLVQTAREGKLTFIGAKIPGMTPMKESEDFDDVDVLIESYNMDERTEEEKLDESLVLAALAFAGIMGAGSSLLGALSQAKINQTIKPLVQDFEDRYLRDAKTELAMASKTIKLINSMDDYKKHEALLESVKAKLQLAYKQVDVYLSGNLIDFENKTQPGRIGQAFQNSTEKKAKKYFETLIKESIRSVEGMIKDLERKRDLFLTAE